jgi:hypothetical protein
MKLHALHLAFLVAATATGAHAATATESPSKFRYNYTLISSDLPPNWTVITKYEDQWEDVGDKYGCSNWSPSTSSQGKGVSFTQTATDCLQDQEKGAQNYRVNNINKEEVKDGVRYTIKQKVTVSSTRDAVGILENWLGIAPTYTSWIDTNALYGCTAWSPNPSTFSTTSNFTQTSSTCKTDQERQRQEREQEKFTSEIRNNGESITEQQTLNGQTATRPYSVTLGSWTAVGESYACTNWSPAVETIGKGIKFTQNATDCKLDQTRTRAESYKDNKSNLVVPVAKPNENRTLTGQASSKESTGTLEQWMATTPTYTAWVDTSAQNACTNWAPNPVIKTSTSTFTQNATNCTTDQARTRQDREMEQNTSEIRNKGVPVAEAQTLTGQSASRSYTVTLAAWADNGAKYACSNWSPAPATVTIGQSFTQTATDCKQDQKRARTESYVDHKTGSVVAAGNTVESQTLSNQTSTQTATGTKETWMATTPTYTAWTTTNGQYACSNWSPAGSSKTATGSFTQTATDCKTDQTRNRQDREQESTTLAIRDKGAVVAEAQTLTAQSATRTYSVTLGSWTNSNGKYACSNWSPSPTTITVGQSFTQTATDCKQDQTRTRAESYVDHKSGATVPVTVAGEAQTLTGQTNTQTATGVKETWVATTPAYTAWANVAAPYNCSNWAPLGSAYSERTEFTQTATNCSVDQTRSRQNRETETTTGAIRNSGSPVAETQTATGQSNTRAYLEDFNGWVFSSDPYNCTNWSPDPSTVTMGTGFTQSASNCQRNMQRGRAGYYMVNGSWTPDSASPYRAENTTVGNQPSTRAATGTKENWVATTPTYTAWANSSGLYSCGAFAPAPSNYTTATQFTQTAYCYVNQSRTRQDRQYETNTGAYRNVGAPVAEGQTLGSQPTYRTYLMDFSAWAWAGDFYSCGGWAPATSSYNQGVVFTQTAYCYRNQQRGAAGYTWNGSGWAADPAVPYRVETVAYSGQPKYQQATGTYYCNRVCQGGG